MWASAVALRLTERDSAGARIPAVFDDTVGPTLCCELFEACADDACATATAGDEMRVSAARIEVSLRFT
jgi:hypothetical protein